MPSVRDITTLYYDYPVTKVVEADEGIFIGNPNVPQLNLNEFLAYNQNYVRFPIENNSRSRVSSSSNTTACYSSRLIQPDVGCFRFLLSLFKIR